MFLRMLKYPNNIWHLNADGYFRFLVEQQEGYPSVLKLSDLYYYEKSSRELFVQLSEPLCPYFQIVNDIKYEILKNNQIFLASLRTGKVLVISENLSKYLKQAK